MADTFTPRLLARHHHFEEKSPEMVLPISTDGRVLLPRDFYDQSVGRAQVETQLDGVTSASKAIRFQTQGGATAAGTYNGTGTGNRALLGLGSWHAKPLGSLTDMRWEAKSDFGTLLVGVILQIDLKCDGGNIVVAEARPAALPAPTAKTDGYAEYRALLTDVAWISLKARFFIQRQAPNFYRPTPAHREHSAMSTPPIRPPV
ncbi:MAG: hypothetical protein IPJ84_11320 [Bdellovibrionales bacterium]|nr:hypothetical protein [Bdellovibrionales bacterium]